MRGGPSVPAEWETERELTVDTGISAQGMQTLSEALDAGVLAVKELGLSSNAIQNQGLTSLCEGLSRSKNALSKLWLYGSFTDSM